MGLFHDIVLGGQKSRRHDGYGSGQFGSSRDGGSRSHRGLDIVTRDGQAVLSPIDGNVLREAHPYKDKPSVTGVVIVGTGDWKGYEIKMFYAVGCFCGPVKAGQQVATAQDLSSLYPGITNHVHIEARKDGHIVNPLDAFGRSF